MSYNHIYFQRALRAENRVTELHARIKELEEGILKYEFNVLVPNNQWLNMGVEIDRLQAENKKLKEQLKEYENKNV